MIISGTKEWAEHSVNCVTGCSHNCRYCYAREMALLYGTIKDPNEWKSERVRSKAVSAPRPLLAGRVMFPTTHDITPTTIEPCLTVIKKLLDSGNHILIVSKPHLDIMQRIIKEIEHWRWISPDITFRFTIGTLNPTLASYWEPGAPSPEERLEASRLVLSAGWPLGFSMEPALESPDALIKLARILLDMATDVVWIGKMNNPRSRWLRENTPRDDGMMSTLESGQTDSCIREVYAALKDDPKIRWKESYKSILGLKLQTEAGEKLKSFLTITKSCE